MKLWLSVDYDDWSLLVSVVYILRTNENVEIFKCILIVKQDLRPHPYSKERYVHVEIMK